MILPILETPKLNTHKVNHAGCRWQPDFEGPWIGSLHQRPGSIQGIALLPVTGKLGSEELGRRGLNVASMEHLQGVQVGRGLTGNSNMGMNQYLLPITLW